MESKKFRDIMDAYSSIYEKKEDPEMEKGEEKEDEGEEEKKGKKKEKEEKGEKEEKEDEKKMKESADLFDRILEHLVSEGYADTNKAALAIMANMSEEWKNSIIEDVYTGPIKRQETKPKPEGGSILGPGRSGDFGKGYERRAKPNVPSPGRAEGGSGRIPDSVIKYGSGG